MNTRPFTLGVWCNSALSLVFVLAGWGVFLEGIAIGSINGGITIADPGDSLNSGILSEWGVVIKTAAGERVNDYSAFSATPTPVVPQSTFTKDGLLFDYWLEDTGNVDFVGPGHGNQNYDAEYLGLTIQNGTTVSIALSSGQRPDNGTTVNGALYSPGDIVIKMASGKVYGIEVGGGAPNTTGGGAIYEGALGYTYDNNSSGYTTGSTPSIAHTAGSIWLASSADDWIAGIPYGPKMVQLKSDAGIYMGMADFVFTLNALGSEHSVIELSFNAGFMGLDKITDITWAPGCGNDQAMLQLTKLSRTVNPEPASLLIWGGIGIGTAFVTWRKRKALAPAK